MLQVKPDRLAFTANALTHAIQVHGDDLFKLVEKHGKFYVSEKALLNHPDVKDCAFGPFSVIPSTLLLHWFDLQEPPYPDNDELEQLFMLASNNIKDDITIVVDNLNEFAFLNRALGQDQLVTVYGIEGV